MKRILCTASTLALCTTPLAAEEPMALGVITLYASYEPTTELQTGVAVDIINEEDLDETGETRLADYLAREPGISLSSSGPLGTRTGLTMRGVSQNNIAVRIDGIDVSDPSGPQVAYDFGGLTTNDISRIEILRGSQSALYGSEAIGGAINITTKRATRDGLSADFFAEYGSYDSLRTGLSLFSRGEGHETAVTLSYSKSDGFSAADENERNYGTLDPDDHNSEDDGFEARRLSFSGKYDVGTGLTLEVAGFAEDAEFDYDEDSRGNIFDGTPDDVTEQNQKGFRTALAYDTGLVEHKLDLSWFEIERTLSGTLLNFENPSPPYAGTPYPFEFDYLGTRWNARYTAAFDLSTALRAVVGAERTVERYENDISSTSRSGPYDSAQDHITSVNALFGELSWAVSPDIDLSFALRHDDHSEYGGFTTGRISGVWRAREDLIFRANIANGFRAPSNYELYAPWGDPDLDPETSTSVDIGVEKRWGDTAWLRATAFWIEADDIIDYSYSTYAYTQTSGTSTRLGLELAGGYAVTPGIRVDGSYTLTDSSASAKLDSSGWLTNTPRHLVSLGLSADLTDRAHLAVTGRYEADRSGLDDYGVMNSTLTYDVTEATEAYLRVENLFDEDYQTNEGYGQSGRAAYFGIRASF